MTRVACLMMQKNEVLLLRPWLLYHGYLFGYENLFVYDNGSSEPAVKAILAQFRTLGVNVDKSHPTPDGFSNKGNLFSDQIRHFREKGRYDVVLPMDCDEFAAIERPGGYSCGRNEILAELRRIDWDSLICRTQDCLYSLPGCFDLFERAGHQKCIVSVNRFKLIDHGFHQAALEPGESYAATSLIYLHLRHRPYASFIANAKDKLRPWTDPDDLAGLQSYDLTGQHLVAYLSMTEDEYYSFRFTSQPALKFDGLRDFLAAHMDVAALIGAWAGRSPAAPAAGGSSFQDLRAMGLQAMQDENFAAAADIWAQCRVLFPTEEEGYLYGAVAAKAAGDEALLSQIRAAQERIFPNIFNQA